MQQDPIVCPFGCCCAAAADGAGEDSRTARTLTEPSAIAKGQHIEIIAPTPKSTGKIERRHGHQGA
jgi:hypothetical protein